VTQASDELWPALVGLWRDYNLHLAHIIAAIPDETLRRPRAGHSLDRIAWQTVPADQPAMLEYLIGDYIGHLQDHVRQILALTRQAVGDGSMNSSIVLLGPVSAGKSTQGRLLSAALGRPQVSLDEERWRYYREIGYDDELAREIRQRGGFLALVMYWGSLIPIQSSDCLPNITTASSILGLVSTRAGRISNACGEPLRLTPTFFCCCHRRIERNRSVSSGTRSSSAGGPELRLQPALSTATELLRTGAPHDLHSRNDA